MWKLIFALLLAVPCAAQTQLYLSENTTSGAPNHVRVNAYKSVDAWVTGNANKGVTWTSTGGTLTNADCAATVNGLCTVVINSAATTGAIGLTATSKADNTVTKTTYIQFDAVQTPTGHAPDFLITTANLAALKTKAVSGNPMWAKQLSIANSSYNNSITQGWTYNCPAGTGSPSANPGYPTDGTFYYFSLMAVLGDTSRQWGCYARAQIMWNMSQLMAGGLPISGNTWSDESVYFILGIGYAVKAGAISSPSDLAAVRTFLAWCGRTFNNYGIGISADPTAGNWNTARQITQGNQWDYVGQRAMGNNYTMSKILWNVGIGLMFNDNTTDDPLLTGTDNTCGAARGVVCPDYTAGSLHAYFLLANQQLLKMYAHLEDPAVSYTVLNLAYPSGGFGARPISCGWPFPYPGATQYDCIGEGSGGESSEGSWYYYSFYRLRLALNLIESSGYVNPTLYGPQVALGHDAVWDLVNWGARLFLTGKYQQGTYVGPAFGFTTTGDANTLARLPMDLLTQTETLTFDLYTQRQDRNNANRWFTMESAYGGALGDQNGCTSYCGFVSEMGNVFAQGSALDMFISQPPTDPTANPATDPGANYPKDWWNGSDNQHQQTRSGFAQTDVVVNIYGTNTAIDHEWQRSGNFDVWTKGGYITKGRTIFTNYNYNMMTAPNQNLVEIYDAEGVAAGRLDTCFAQYTGPYGGQLWHGFQKGLQPPALHSEMPHYAFFEVDQSNAYTGCYLSNWQFVATTTAVRSWIYLRDLNALAWYDRVATATAADKKVLFLNTTGNGTLAGNSVTWTSVVGGNAAQFTSLLPAGATVAVDKLVNSLTVSAPNSTLALSGSMQATCTAQNGDGTTRDVTSTASWYSTDNTIFTVSATGLVHPVAVGAASLGCQVGTGGLPPVTGFNAPPPFYSTATLTITAGRSGGGKLRGSRGWSGFRGDPAGPFQKFFPVSYPWGRLNDRSVATGSNDYTQPNDWEMVGNVSVTPAGTPTSAHFLSGLAWGSSRPTMTLVQSTAGQGYDCALAGTSLACFRQTLGAFTGVTLPLSGATSVYVVDLTPNTSYPVTATGAPSTCTTDNAGVCAFAASGSGSAVIGAGSPPPSPANPPSGLSGTVSGTTVALTWTASSTSGATSTVFRLTAACPTPLAGGSALASGVSGTTYSDSSVAQATHYCYYLTAQAAGVPDSGPSNGFDIDVPAGVTQPPSGLTGGIVVNGGKVQ
jgi:hypothetical protein